MARPPKTQSEKPVREKIEDTLLLLLEDRSLAQVTVSELVRRVGCNRATFYYHFDSVDDLADCIVEESIPSEIPLLVKSYLSGTIESITLSPESKKSIERLRVLVGKNGSPLLTAKMQNALKEIWLEMFHLTDSDMDEESRSVVEFMVGGVVSLLGHHGDNRDYASLERCLQSVSSVFSKPAIEFAQKQLGKIASQGMASGSL